MGVHKNWCYAEVFINGLIEDLQLGQLRGLKCKVRILNPASGSRQVGRDIGQVVHRVI